MNSHAASGRGVPEVSRPEGKYGAVWASDGRPCAHVARDTPPSRRVRKWLASSRASVPFISAASMENAAAILWA